MQKISDCIIPSAALTISKHHIDHYEFLQKPPVNGDVVYGEVMHLGKHTRLENKFGRLHSASTSTKAIFVFGNRYAPDVFEGVVPDKMCHEVDLLARSGVVGVLKSICSAVAHPTRIKIFGYACNAEGEILNTRNFSKIKTQMKLKKPNRSKMILIVGSAMNSGKTACAAACCWALSMAGHNVRGAKITGVASLKDILYMQDAGASIVKDFTHFGYPSTYLLDKEEVLRIFNLLDLKNANNQNNYWVVELADGILQRETAMLLSSDDVTSRIHKLIFASRDPLGVIGGLDILRKKYNLVPDAISGIFSQSPLFARELSEFINIPILNTKLWDQKQFLEVLECSAKVGSNAYLTNMLATPPLL